jgi:PPOX class probable F420-dependent enzyme
VSGVPRARSSGSVEAPPWAWAMLRHARVARLATADASGAPHLVPVCFVLDDAGALWTPIDAKPKSTRALRRVKNLAENPRATLLVDHYEEDWRELRWVAVHGLGELVTGEASAPALRALREKYPQYAEVEIGPEAIRLVPDRIVAWSSADAS